VWPIEGRDVVATAHHGRVRLWDVDTRTPRPSPDGGTTRVIAVALGDLAGRAALVTGSEGGLLALWDAATTAPIARIRLDARIDTVWVVRGADVVAALTEDRVLHLFDVVTRRDSADEPGP
jgi:WD40 repeat protein